MHAFYPLLTTVCSTGEEAEKTNKEFARKIRSGSRLVLQVLEVKKTCLEVDLVMMSVDGAISIRDQLVFLGLAYFAPKEEIHELPNIFREKIESHQLDLKVGEIHKGYVGHIPFAHPGDWVQISVLVSSAVPVYKLPRSVKLLFVFCLFLRSEHLLFPQSLLLWF